MSIQSCMDCKHRSNPKVCRTCVTTTWTDNWLRTKFEKREVKSDIKLVSSIQVPDSVVMESNIIHPVSHQIESNSEKIDAVIKAVKNKTSKLIGNHLPTKINPNESESIREVEIPR